MGIASFTFTHKGINRQVDVKKLTFEPSGTAVQASIQVRHKAVITDDELQSCSGGHRNLIYQQGEIVTALMAIAAEENITITPAQIGKLILGLSEKLIRTDLED